MTSTWELAWEDVAPSSHALDTEGLDASLRDHLARLPKQREKTWKWKSSCFAEIDDKLASRCGEWARGWRQGDINKSWCYDSFFPKGYDPAQIPETAKAIVYGLTAWRGHLKDLEKLFSSLANDAECKEKLDLAVCRVVDAVIDATGCDDAWYGYAEQVVAWYLEYRGIEKTQARQVAAKALDGRFESWTKPPPEIKSEASTAVAEAARALLTR